MEKMVNKRLVHVLDERNLLPEQKYGFRKNRSTTDVLNILNTHIIEAIRKKEYSAMISLDISRAYDTCWRRGVFDTIKT
jgi:Reverse transcriptase (RNA-dependent DNA polymerase)